MKKIVVIFFCFFFLQGFFVVNANAGVVSVWNNMNDGTWDENNYYAIKFHVDIFYLDGTLFDDTHQLSTLAGYHHFPSSHLLPLDISNVGRITIFSKVHDFYVDKERSFWIDWFQNDVLTISFELNSCGGGSECLFDDLSNEKMCFLSPLPIDIPSTGYSVGSVDLSNDNIYVCFVRLKYEAGLQSSFGFFTPEQDFFMKQTGGAGRGIGGFEEGPPPPPPPPPDYCLSTGIAVRTGIAGYTFTSILMPGGQCLKGIKTPDFLAPIIVSRVEYQFVDGDTLHINLSRDCSVPGEYFITYEDALILDVNGDCLIRNVISLWYDL